MPTARLRPLVVMALLVFLGGTMLGVRPRPRRLASGRELSGVPSRPRRRASDAGAPRERAARSAIALDGVGPAPARDRRPASASPARGPFRASPSPRASGRAARTKSPPPEGLRLRC